jgi:hypothetical protein
VGITTARCRAAFKRRPCGDRRGGIAQGRGKTGCKTRCKWVAKAWQMRGIVLNFCEFLWHFVALCGILQHLMGISMLIYSL